MSKSRLEWKVGLFVLIGLVLLGVLLIGFSKGLTFFRSTYDIYLHSENVGGLKPSAAVLMSGVQVGTVSDIKLAPDGKSVTIVLRIFSNFTIHKDAKFSMEQSGFLGDQYVAIRPTENRLEPFKNGDRAESQKPFDIQAFLGSSGELIGRLEGTASNLNVVIGEVQRLLLNPQTLTNVALTVGNLRLLSERALTTVDGLNTLITSNNPAVSQAASNLVFFSEQINGLAGGLTNLVATNAPSINAAVKNIESSTAVMKALMADVQAGKGLAGSVLKNDQLAASMSQTVNNLAVTSSNLNRLGLWGILWKRKPPKNEPPASAAPLTTPKDPFAR